MPTEHKGTVYETGTAGSIVLHCPKCDPGKTGPFRFRLVPNYWWNPHNECCWDCGTEMEPIPTDPEELENAAQD